MKKPRFLERIRIHGGWGFAQSPRIRFSSPGKAVSHHPAGDVIPTALGVDGSRERVGLHSGKEPLILPDWETRREGAKVVGFRFLMGGLSTRWLTTLFVVPILSGNNRLQ